MSSNEIKKLYSYDTIEDFEDSKSFTEGNHQIQTGNGFVLEILIRGELGAVSKGTRIPLFLTGAVTDRASKSKPFFSGLGVSKRLSSPLISIADPVVSKYEDIGLAWYTGAPSTHTYNVMQRAIAKISRHFEREILAIGGSGGGFACLAVASENPSVMAFVWNPQTNILNYLPDFVKPYLEHIFGGEWSSDDWKVRAKAKLESEGLVYDLTKIPVSKNFLYLQNESDWHVSKHCAQFIDATNLHYKGGGLYSDGGNGVIQIANFGKGHLPPSKELIFDALSALLSSDSTSVSALEALHEKGHLDATDFNYLPRDLRKVEGAFDELCLDVSSDDGRVFHCLISNLPDTLGPLTIQFHGMQESVRVGGSSKSTRSKWYWNSRRVNRVECDIWDGFGYFIGRFSTNFHFVKFADNPRAWERYAMHRMVLNL